MADARSPSRRTLAGILAVLALLGLVGWWMRGDSAPDLARAPLGSPSTHREAPSNVRIAAEPSVEATPEPTEARREPEEEQDLPEGIPMNQILCRLEPALPAGQGHLVVGEIDHIPYDGRRVSVSEGLAVLPYVELAGHGVLAVDGFAPVHIEWSEQGCLPSPVQLVTGESWLTGHVRNAEGEPEGKVFVEGCGNQSLTDAEGMYAMAVAPGSCTANAFRRDGLLVGKADAADVVIVEGKEQTLDFILPELPTAGLGIMIAAEEGGFAIQGVVSGTAADELGLESGDVVIEVDGTPTPGLSIEEFVDLAVGPVGTEVDIIVVRDGQQQRLTLDRREITRGPG